MTIFRPQYPTRITFDKIKVIFDAERYICKCCQNHGVPGVPSTKFLPQLSKAWCSWTAMTIFGSQTLTRTLFIKKSFHFLCRKIRLPILSKWWCSQGAIKQLLPKLSNFWCSWTVMTIFGPKSPTKTTFYRKHVIFGAERYVCQYCRNHDVPGVPSTIFLPELLKMWCSWMAMAIFGPNSPTRTTVDKNHVTFGAERYICEYRQNHGVPEVP